MKCTRIDVHYKSHFIGEGDFIGGKLIGSNCNGVLSGVDVFKILLYFYMVAILS